MLGGEIQYGYRFFYLLNNCEVCSEKYLQVKEISIRQIQVLPKSVMSKCKGAIFYIREVRLFQNYV